MLQLHNSTPFAANMALFPNEDAIDTLYIIVRATFNISSKWTLVDEQPPPLEADIYWADPETSSIKYASDYHTGKPSTDVVVVGNAFAPPGKPVQKMNVHFVLGNMQKAITVFGDREWRDGNISTPKPFQSMPVIYERAFGGQYKIEDTIQSAELRNLVGTGFAGGRKGKEMNGVALPNLEDPAYLITEIKDQPKPACFAFCSPNWQPRLSYAGTYDENWQKKRAPYLPLDYDRRFLNMAHPDLIYSGYLQGGEPVQIMGMHEKGNLQFSLPYVKLAATVKIGNTEERPILNMETLLIEPNDLKLSMVWKAALPCDKKAQKIETVNISLAR
ncbi:MAG: DUF2169 domain-containing protein [Gammaproteobacteria bacterium]|nr:DUF2169 domain-containing protein [Gammaproteobacteria bacterium]MDH5652751.1 DUF2169 domain-containing protein [Gammaproteobacteria bacterium]